MEENPQNDLISKFEEAAADGDENAKKLLERAKKRGLSTEALLAIAMHEEFDKIRAGSQQRRNLGERLKKLRKGAASQVLEFKRKLNREIADLHYNTKTDWKKLTDWAKKKEEDLKKRKIKREVKSAMDSCLEQVYLKKAKQLINEKGMKKGDLKIPIELKRVGKNNGRYAGVNGLKKFIDEHKNDKGRGGGAIRALLFLGNSGGEVKGELIDEIVKEYRLPELENNPNWKKVNRLSDCFGKFSVKTNDDVVIDAELLVDYLKVDEKDLPNSMKRILDRMAINHYMPIHDSNPGKTINDLERIVNGDTVKLSKRLASRTLRYLKQLEKVDIPGFGTLTNQKDTHGYRLRNFQFDGAKFISGKKRVLVADDMGMFKTAQTIFGKALIEKKIGKIPSLVVCPNMTKDHWVKEIYRWYRNGRVPRVAVIKGDTVEIKSSPDSSCIEKRKLDDILNEKDAERIKNDYDVDFVIANYESFSREKEDGSLAHKRDLYLSRFNLKHIVADEVHNANHPHALRTKALRDIINSSEYVTMLSGTPVPNSILDLYMILHYLDPKNFNIDLDSDENIGETMKNFAFNYVRDEKYRNDVKKILHSKMIRRKTDRFLKRDVPRLENEGNEIVEVPLYGDHLKVYEEIFNNEKVDALGALNQLRKASLDPLLVDPKYIQDRELRKKVKKGLIKSCKYEELQKRVKEAVDAGKKVLIFKSSVFTKGVTSKYPQRGIKDPLERVLGEDYREYNPVVIDKDVDTDSTGKKISKRNLLRLKFQFGTADKIVKHLADQGDYYTVPAIEEKLKDLNVDPNVDTKVMLATLGTMNEGVDVTGADVMINLDLPDRPSDVDQGDRRSRRVGEIKKKSVRIDRLIAKVPDLRSMDEGIYQRIMQKKENIAAIFDHVPVTIEDLVNSQEDKIKTTSPGIDEAMPIRWKTATGFFNKHTGKGQEKFQEDIELKEIGKRIARAQASNLETGYGGNTARVYTKVIEGLESVLGKKDCKYADLASGPATLSYFLRKPVDCVDINPFTLKQGQKLAAPGSKFYPGFLIDLPKEMGSKKYDFAVYSLALHLLGERKQTDQGMVREREKSLREVNKILKKDGYLILTAPEAKMNAKNVPEFYEGLEKLGFKVIPQLSGFVKAKEKGKKFKVYMIVAQKYSEPKKIAPGKHYFRMSERPTISGNNGTKIISKNQPRKKATDSKGGIRDKGSEEMMKERKICREFEILKGNNYGSLVDAIKSYVQGGYK
ncbi:SNF2-related protein [Nanoarchaeota archaeon]